MTAIWKEDESGWSLLTPRSFADEDELHTLVERSPGVLPLAGSPQLVVLGREVPLGNGRADLLAIEPNGRLVIIEVKLKQNAEARRAVVAQVLMYAAFLKGLDLEGLENALRNAPAEPTFTTLANALAAGDQEGSFDAEEIEDGLAESLSQGRFRLVLVLDEAPSELVRLVGYLASIADKVLIDLVTVSSYELPGSRILVPQRVDPEHETPVPQSLTARSSKGRLVEGAEDFAESISKAREDLRPALEKLCSWARSLADQDLVRLQTYHTKNGFLTLLPRLRADNAGLVTICHDSRGGYIQFWDTVFKRRAPVGLTATNDVLAASGERPVGSGNATRNISDPLLQALTSAYREAATGRITA